MRKIIVITGAAGNLGRKLGAALGLSGQYELRLLDLVADPASSIHQADISRVASEWTGLLAGADVIVHFAGNANPAAPWDQLIAPNVDGLLNLYLAAAQAGVGRIVLASSVWVLQGHRFAPVPLSATTPPDPGRNAYGATKLFAERVGKAFFAAHGLTTVALRLGACQSETNDAAAMARASEWNQECWLSDADMIHGVETAIEANVSGFEIMTLRSANPTSRWDLSVAERLGYRPKDACSARVRLSQRIKSLLFRIGRSAGPRLVERVIPLRW